LDVGGNCGGRRTREEAHRAELMTKQDEARDMARSDEAWSYTRVKLPDGALADAALDVAAPLLVRDEASSLDGAREVLALVVPFWNASLLASERWERRRMKAMNELKKRMRD
jgi:hypothetical protein